MNRNFVLGGAWSLALSIGVVCVAADTNRQNNQPVPPPAPRANQGPATGGGRFAVQPSNNGNNDAARRAAQSAAAARNAAAARVLQPQLTTPSGSGSSYSIFRGYYPYGGYGYFSPYGYPYSPYGTTPYALGYDPYSGQAYLYPYSGGYYGNSPYAYRYPYYTNPYLGFGYPGAVFANPGQLFGLGPIEQLMGGGQGIPQQANAGLFGNGNGNLPANGNNNANPGLGNANNPGGNAQANGNAPPAPAPRKPVVAGTKAMELAWKFISFGDARFGDLKYAEALDRYRRATHECPTLGDAWFREGFALAGMGNYDQAAKAMRRGLEEKPDWADTNFRLDDVYGDNAADKKARIDAMLKLAESDQNNGDLALVLGIHLYCDGKQDQAAPFFRRAAQIQGSDENIKPFLPKAD
jgi:tetratricopeptide (TPR) repeat protein